MYVQFWATAAQQPGAEQDPRDGMGCCTPVVLVLAGREEGAWGNTRGSLLSHPRGCRAAGPPPRAAVTLLWYQPHCQLVMYSLASHPHGLRGLSAPPKELFPRQSGAPGCWEPQGHCPRDISVWLTSTHSSCGAGVKCHQEIGVGMTGMLGVGMVGCSSLPAPFSTQLVI